jgi:hypothetical protein
MPPFITHRDAPGSIDPEARHARIETAAFDIVPEAILRKIAQTHDLL